MKKRILVVAPGRGTYTKDTLGYLKKHSENSLAFVNELDQWKSLLNEPTVSELDNSQVFKSHIHTKGENASALIFACSYADFINLDYERYEIVAVTGNSMGWYSALVIAGALNLKSGFELINTMGSMMKDKVIGGQIIYPFTNEDWTYNNEIKQAIFKTIEECNHGNFGQVFPSIYLGGYLVIGGDQEGLSWLMKKLPPKEHFPFQLINHAAFHTPLMDETSMRAFQSIKSDIFQSPKYPLIDGRGKIWQTYSTDTEELYSYTLGNQVYAPYSFTQAITVGLKEFAPDHIVLLGPGNTLGGSIGQILVNEQWLDIKNKSDFQSLQKKHSFLISLGM